MAASPPCSWKLGRLGYVRSFVEKYLSFFNKFGGIGCHSGWSKCPLYNPGLICGWVSWLLHLIPSIVLAFLVIHFSTQIPPVWEALPDDQSESFFPHLSQFPVLSFHCNLIPGIIWFMCVYACSNFIIYWYVDSIVLVCNNSVSTGMPLERRPLSVFFILTVKYMRHLINVCGQNAWWTDSGSARGSLIIDTDRFWCMLENKHRNYVEI